MLRSAFLSLRRLTAVCVVVGLAVPAAALADDYVALGDSFSSGVGTSSYTLSSSCKRGVYAYPYLLAQQRAGTALSFVACSGATTSSLMSSQIGAVNAGTDLVTVTIGGNDIGFAGLIYQCTLGECSSALDSTRASVGTFLPSRLATVYDAIRAQAPAATVVVLGYPRMFSSSGCFGTLGISTTERTKANQLADALDATIASAVFGRTGFVYKSALVPWTGHAVCSGSAWLNGLNLFNTGESYHPNRAGNSQGYLPLVRAVTG